MDFFLVRHGEARLDREDSRRPLSARGRRQVEKIARAAAAKEIDVAEILHSGKLRAQETAEILAEFLSPARQIREISGLSPEDDPFVLKAELETAGASLMLVGHLPHLSRLTALLLAGDSEKKVADFTTATMVCLARTEEVWSLGWILRPDEA
jgi:phosphohistidine phosphatase